MPPSQPGYGYGYGQPGYQQEFSIYAADGSLRHMSEYVRIKPLKPGDFALVGVGIHGADGLFLHPALQLVPVRRGRPDPAAAVSARGAIAAGDVLHGVRV